MACSNGCETSICDMMVLSVQRSAFLFFLPNLIFYMLSFFIMQIIAWFYPSWPRASWAEHQTEFGDNSGVSLLIKFGGSQGTQDVKTVSSYWQNNICFASNWQNLWTLKLGKVP